MTDAAPSRPRRWPARLALLGAVALTAGCADRLDHFGKPPTISPMANPREAIDPSLKADPAQLAALGAQDMATGTLGPGTRHDPRMRSRALAREASLWSSGPGSLFDDRRARVIGDILTVTVSINDQATIQNDTSRSRTADDDANIAALLGYTGFLQRILPGDDQLTPGIDTTSSTSTTGAGAITRNEQVDLSIAATVVDVLHNGHLVITGNQEIRINSELRDLQIAGVVRPEDISRSNSITLDKIANARVSYGGRGQITDVQDPTILQQVLGLVSPF